MQLPHQEKAGVILSPVVATPVVALATQQDQDISEQGEKALCFALGRLPPVQVAL